jgi:hypothetical protein
MDSITKVAASPKTTRSSSNAPMITARKTCHSLLPKLMSVLLLHSFCRINAMPGCPLRLFGDHQQTKPDCG